MILPGIAKIDVDGGQIDGRFLAVILHPPGQPRFAHIFGGLDQHHRLLRFWPQQLLKAKELTFLVDKKGRVVNVAHKRLQIGPGCYRISKMLGLLKLRLRILCNESHCNIPFGRGKVKSLCKLGGDWFHRTDWTNLEVGCVRITAVANCEWGTVNCECHKMEQQS